MKKVFALIIAVGTFAFAMAQTPVKDAKPAKKAQTEESRSVNKDQADVVKPAKKAQPESAKPCAKTDDHAACSHNCGSCNHHAHKTPAPQLLLGKNSDGATINRGELKDLKIQVFQNGKLQEVKSFTFTYGHVVLTANSSSLTPQMIKALRRAKDGATFTISDVNFSTTAGKSFVLQATYKIKGAK